jgi:hypothetical protein
MAPVVLATVRSTLDGGAPSPVKKRPSRKAVAAGSREREAEHLCPPAP